MLGDDQFDQQHRGSGAGRRANVAQDLRRLFVGPVVDDVLEDVGVATGRNAVEKRPLRDTHPVGDVVFAQQARCIRDYPRQVVKYAPRCRRSRQDGGQQRTVPAAHVDDRRVGAEVVAGHHRRVRQFRNARHRLVEKFGKLGLPGEVVEAFLAAQCGHDRAPGSDRVHHQGPTFALFPRPVELCRPSHRDRCVRTQGGGKGIQLIASVAAMTEDALADQGPQQPAQRVRVGAYPGGQLLDRQRSVSQGIGDTELGRHGDRLRRPGGNDHLHHRCRRGCQPLMEPIQVVANPLDNAGQLGGWHRAGRPGRSTHLASTRWMDVAAPRSLLISADIRR